MAEITNQRVVAIVGRPNVGKSALFNRLAGRRIAIVHEESGVTRDRVSCEAQFDGKRFELIDTGGIGMMDRAATTDAIVRGTRDQVDVAIQDAAVILFVTDVSAGVAPLDQDVAKLLHASGKTVFLAANKSDHAGMAAGAPEFESLGFPVFAVSALHGRGVDELMAAVLKQLPPAPPREERPALKVAVVGRPNVGKSSYINRLLGRTRLIVSDVPGTTRDSIEIPFSIGPRDYRLIDTAGMRKVTKVHTSVERFSVFRAEKSIERADVVVLILDAVEGPTVQDKKIAAKIVEAHKGCVLVVNKWDLAKGVTEEEYEKALRKVMYFFDFVPILFLSAQSGFNMKKSLQLIDHVAAQVSIQLTTGLLNRVLRDAFERVQPPLIHGHRLKFYYATQTGAQPVWIRLFVNDPRRASEQYRTYLVSCLRKAFGFEGAPVVLDFRSSHERAPEKT